VLTRGYGVSFQDKIQSASKSRKSKIVLALDLEDRDPTRLASKSSELLRKVSEYVCAVKINRQLVLALGLRNGVDSIVKMAHEFSLPAIMDAKLNDIGHTNEFMARMYMDVGFDAIIASPVAGWDDGLDEVFRLANLHGKSIILLVYMSNPGAETFYSLNVSGADQRPRPVFELLTELAVRWKSHGVIVGATKPEIISRVRSLAGSELAIYSPGVGVQGGDPRKALKAGADYLIVGRTIYNAEDPERAARELRDLTA
jgi:orotidine-5'-phosphate decarboxylase